MRNFKLLTLLVLFLLSLITVGCDASNEKSCPECHMPVTSFIHSAKVVMDDELYFDDIGCMILYSKKHNIDLKSVAAMVFTNDTKTYIDVDKAYYLLGEDTPMRYGFGAYEFALDGAMKFDEVYVKMLRGENMSNPKIRKKIKLAGVYNP